MAAEGGAGAAVRGVDVTAKAVRDTWTARERERIFAHLGREAAVEWTSFGVGRKVFGKVRDVYDLGDRLVLAASDRLSAFDRNLVCVPRKGQVLTQVSRWWFSRTEDIVPNHVEAYPHASVLVCRKHRVFPIEFVVRAYMTGSTGTSLWTHYSRGARSYCGNELPEGLRKNDLLPGGAILTPTTKETEHDRPISPAEIVAEGWMTQAEWDAASAIALRLFERGRALASERGLLLVDTKYELGVDEAGRVVLVDEIHTPDSSRYWIADSYAERHAAGLEPENIDKEFLRLWYKERCDPYADADLPVAPTDLVAELAWRYLLLHEMITGDAIPVLPDSTSPAPFFEPSAGAMQRALLDHLGLAQAPVRQLLVVDRHGTREAKAFLDGLDQPADASRELWVGCSKPRLAELHKYITAFPSPAPTLLPVVAADSADAHVRQALLVDH